MKVHAVSLCRSFDPNYNIFVRYLIDECLYRQDAISPDLLFFSVFGNKHLEYKNCIKILVTGENRKAPAEQYDFSISFDDNSATNLLFPVFLTLSNNSIEKTLDAIRLLGSFRHETICKNNKDKFCNFIYSSSWNPNRTPREVFCTQLQHYYKHIDCPGRSLNNMPNFGTGRFGNWMEEKVEFIKQYKFTIAFENESEINYVTEKLFHPLLAGSIPIYWGAPNINDYFNPKCFINLMDFETHREVLEYIKEVDNNDELYESYFKEPPIHPESKLNQITKENIFAFFDKIIKTSKNRKA